MSHEITAVDQQQGIEQAWHGLTKILPEIKLRESWLAQWDVVRNPLSFEIPGTALPVSARKIPYDVLTASDMPGFTIGRPHC